MSLLRFNKNKKRTQKRTFAALAGFIFVSVSLASCNVGLGESVDTDPPSLEITYPAVTAVIRDKFILYGTWKDDKGVTSIQVSVRNTGTNETVISEVPATINTDNTWQIELNDYDSANSNYYNGWQLADGTYEVTAIASDDANHKSGIASRTFDIDNTPPVFIISNPGVVKDESSTASAYGTTFTIEGTISDDHTISSMDVVIYNSNGDIVSSETYDGETIDSFHEDDIATAGGTSVTIAQSGDSRYSQVYTLEEGTEYYTASVKLTDSAKVYQTPTDESSNARSAAETKADATGNSTYTVYLYDDVYTKLMSAKKGEGLSASDLKNILNGTYTADAAKKSTALALLNEKAKDTEGKNDAKNLYFSLNPQANPTYMINGFDWDFNSSRALQTASNGNALSVTVSAGLDNYGIDLDGNDNQASTVKVWLKEFDERPSDKDSVLAEFSKLSSQVSNLESNDYKDETQSFVEYSKATDTSAVTSFNGYNLIYDYAQSNSGNSSSVTTKTFSVTIPSGAVVLGKYYLIAVTGADVEDVPFLQNAAYGFEGNETGVAPTVVIDTPSSGELFKSSDGISFTGTASLSSGSLYVAELSALLTVADDSSKTVGTKKASITRSSAEGEWSGDSNAIACTTSKDDNGALSWTFTPSLLEGYADIQAAELSGKSYTYTLELYAKSSSKHDVTVTRYVQVDSTAPVVEISSITPTVAGSEYDDSSNTYINGTITVKGTVEETNLSGPDDGTDYNGVVMQIYAGGELAKTYNLGKVYAFTQTIDTTEFEDNSSLDIRVTAVDKVGNSAAYSSLGAAGTSYSKLVILQETDRPQIALGNSSNSSGFTSGPENISEANGNLFGTTTNNRLSATITDDDTITRISVTVYDADGNLLDGSKVYDGYNANPYTVNPNKSSYSLTYYLPPEEGVYKVCIDAYDYLETAAYTKEVGKGTTGIYYIAVSAGAPALTIKDVDTYQTETPRISGTVSSSANTVSAVLTASSGTESTVGTDYASGKSGTVSWNAKFDEKLSDGYYTILFAAKNKWGQENTATASFTVDTAEPVLSVKQYGSTVVSGGVSSETSFYIIPSNTHLVKGTVSDGEETGASGVESVYFCIGDIPDGDISTSNGWQLAALTNTGWTASITDDMLNDQSDGSVSYALNIAAKDKAGNPSAVNSYIKLYPDGTSPVTTLSAAAGLYGADGTLASALEGGSTYYATSSFTLGGAITEKAVSSLKINGKEATLGEAGADGTISWTYEQSVLSEGTNTYTVTLADKAGNQTSYSLDVVKDMTAPALAITSPSAGENVDGTVTVAGTVNDSGIGVKSVTYTASITMTDSSSATGTTTKEFSDTKELDANGTFSFETQNLTSEGTCTLTVSAVDKMGNTSSTSPITFYYDKTGPVISDLAVTTQAVGTYTDSSGSTYSVYPSTGLAVSAKAADAFTSVSSVTAGSAILSGSSGTYTGNVIVSTEDDGTATVKFTAADSFGNTTEKSLTGILVDTTAPAVTLNASSITSTSASFAISGNASDNIALASGGNIVVLNGATQVATATADAGGGWSVNVTPGSDGRYTYKVYALDMAGNRSAEETFTATVDTKAPSATASASSAKVYLDESGYITLTSTATDTADSSYNSGVASVYYYIGESSTAPAFAASSWTLMTQTSSSYSATVNLADSPYSVSSDKTLYAWFAAVDNAGNSSVSSSATAITCDAKAPVISVMNGSANVTSGNTIKLNNAAVSLEVTVTDTNALSLSGTTTNADSPSVTATEKTSSSVSGSKKVYNVSFTALSDGSATTATLTAKDENGREGTFSVVVECDTTDPVVAIDSTVSALTNASPVTITGTVTEKNLSGVSVTLKGVTDASKSYTGTTSTKQSESVEDTYTFTSTFYGVDDGEYTATVTAVDEYGNTGTGTKKITSDRTAPAVSTGEVSGQAAESGNNGYFSFSFTAEVSDALSGIESVELADNAYTGLATYESESAANAANIGAATEYAVVSKDSSGKTYTYKLYHVASGAHTFTVAAKDKAGNQGSAEKSVSADATAPVITINGISPTVTKDDKVYVNGNIMVTGLVTEETTLTSTTAADNMLAVEVLDSDSKAVENAVIASGTQASEGWTNNTVLKGTYSSFTFTVDTTKLTDEAEYTIKVDAKDAAGNSAETKTYKITPLQSTDEPVLVLSNADSAITGWDSITDGSTNVFDTSSNNTIKGTITDDDGIASVEVSVTPENGAAASKTLLTGGKSTSYTLNTTLADLGITEEGAYTLAITVKDTLQAGDYSKKTSTLYIAVDNSDPAVTVAPTPNLIGGSEYYSSSIPVTITAGDTSKIVKLAMSGDGVSSGYASEKEVVSSTSADSSATVTDTITISSLSDKTSGGYYTAVYTAKDRWGKTKTGTVQFYKDSSAPTLNDTDSSVGGTATISAVAAETKWFKDETLSVTTVFDEAGSGVDTVYFWLDPKDSSENAITPSISGAVSGWTTPSSSATASNSSGKATVRTSLSGFSETTSSSPHILYVAAVDKAGNVSGLSTYTVKVDATAPDFASSYYTYDGANFFAASGTILSNTQNDLTVYGTVSDSASGTDGLAFTAGSSNSSVSPALSYTVSDLSSVADGKGFAGLSDWAEYSTITDKTKITGWKAVFSASGIKTGSVKATPKDTAGNGSAQQIFIVNVDTESPKVEYTALSDADKNTAGTQINGYVQIAGTASDNMQLGSVTKLQYQFAESESALSASGWNDFAADVATITDGSYTWVADYFDTASVFASADSSKPVFFRAIATDSAGNDSAHSIANGKQEEANGDYSQAYLVDQNSDRPVVKITGLSLTNGSYILKYGENSAISGTVTDDDSTNSQVVKTFIASSQQITSGNLSSYTSTTDTSTGVVTTTRKYTPSGSSTELAETTTFTPATGDWTYTPGDGSVDGEKTVYFYIVDNDEVVSTSSTTSGSSSTTSGTSSTASGTSSATAATGSRTFSTPQSATTDETALLKVPYIYYGTILADDSSAAVIYRSDSNSPKVENIQGRYGSSSSIADETEYEGLSSSFVSGGSTGRYVQLKVTASDNNGIAGMLLDVTDANKNVLYKRATASAIDGATFSTTTNASSAAEYYVDSASVETASDGTTVTWTLDAIDLGSASTGQITVTVTPYDKSGLSGNGAYSFILDNTGPGVTLTSPSSSQTLAGSSIKISGVSTDTGGSAAASTQWLIPTTTQASSDDAALIALENWSDASYENSWSFTFSGTSTEKSSLAYYANTAYGTADGDGIYTLPLYFKATDELGNAAVTKCSIKYNPDADRPVAAITYPDSSILAKDSSSGSTLDYAILGGTIRVTGTVEIPSGESVYSVYLQISEDDGGFDSDDKTKAGTGGYGYTVVDAETLESSWRTAYSLTNASALNFNNDSSANTTRRSAWWGIPATLYTSGTSWYITLNSNKELNAASGTNNIKIRVCGVGANGKVSTWSDAYSIHIDSKVPLYSDSPLLYKYADDVVSTGSTTTGTGSTTTGTGSTTTGTGTGSATGETFYNATPSAVRPYSAGMYLKGQWYVYTTVTDETAVKVNGVSTSSGALAHGTDYFVYPESADNSSGSAAGSSATTTINSETRYIAYIYIKVDQSKTTTQTYTVTSEDSDSGNTNSASVSFELNADNVAPAFALNSSGNPVLTDGNGDEIAMTKLKNSNHVVTFGSSATDAGSGFERLMFYFKRVVSTTSTSSGQASSTTTTTVELPLPSGNSSTNLWTTDSSTAYVGESSALATDTDLTDTVDSNYNSNTLYGVSLTGTTAVDSTAGTTTFTVTSPADLSTYKFIRKGGVIKLSGVYYTISEVSGSAITVSEALSSTPTAAFVPAAIVVDNTSAESTGVWSSGFTIAGDDGDGIIESVKKSGSTWTWDASVFLDELEDGPVTLVALAFDAAGNVRTLETKMMIANNTPRLAKVYLATDLNGDGKFTDNELGTSTLADTNDVVKYYSALTNGSTGSAQEILTIENASGSGTTGLTMRDKLGLAFEFVSGQEGYGNGNGNIFYNMKVGSAALTSPSSGTANNNALATNSNFDSTTGTQSATAAALKGFEIPTSAFYSNGSNVTTYGTYSEYSKAATSNTTNYIGVTLWDSTKGTTPGTGDTTDANGKITAFGSQYTVVNIPLYIDLIDDQFPVPNIAAVEPAETTSGSSTTPNGHVELKSTLPSTNFSSSNSGEYDTDTKISGTVVFTGTVTDEKRVSAIYLATSSQFNSTAVSTKEVATYNTTGDNAGNFTLATDLPTGLTFAIESSTFSTETGHTVNWKLTVDSSYVEKIAASDVTFTVSASDGQNTNSKTNTESTDGVAASSTSDGTTVWTTAQYKVDIVPYITGIYRSKTSNSVISRTYRSTYGEYPVAVGDTLTVTGFNLPHADTTANDTTTVVKVGSTALATNASTGDSLGKQFTLDGFTRSGELTVTVNNIASLNDKNNNAVSTNQETAASAQNNAKSSTVEGNVLYDNRYLRVWDVGHYFSNSVAGNEPTLATDNQGNLFTTWTLMGTGSVQLQRGLNKDNYPIYVSYDQPDKESWISIDKSQNNGKAVVSYFPANVGNSGTPDSTLYAQAQTIGGAWGASVPNNITSKEDSTNGYYFYTMDQRKYVHINGNPYYYFDSKISSSGFQLAGYSMRREVSQFKNGRSARKGENMHFVYYDKYNSAVRYSYQKETEKSYTSKDLSSSTANANNTDITGWILIDGKSDGQDRVHTTTLDIIGNTATSAGGSNNIDVSKRSITLTNSYEISVGDTIAFAYTNTSGVYSAEIHTISKVGSTTSGKATSNYIEWNDYDYSHGNVEKCTGWTIYRGESNVVTSSVENSSSAGSYLALDLTTGGKPVIVYYDAINETLRIAYSTSATPSMTDTSTGRDTWTRQSLSGTVSGGTYVQAKIDGDNYLHILYRDSEGQLCYIKSTNKPDGAAYTFDKSNIMVVDTSGTYGTLSVIKSTSGSTATYTPCVSWLNSEGTANGVKYAVLRSVDQGAAKDNAASNGDVATKQLWDTMIVPAVSGNYVSGGEYVYVEGNSGSWSVTDEVATGDCDAIVGYNTGRMDVVFLKSEK